MYSREFPFLGDTLKIHENSSVDRIKELLYPQLGNEGESFRNFIELYYGARTPAEREMYKFLRAVALICFASENARFYREKWGGNLRFEELIANPTILLKLSPVTKDEMRFHTEEWMEQMEQLENAGNGNVFPRTSYMTRQPKEGWSTWNTGGSSGYSTISVRSSEEWELYAGFGGKYIFPQFFSPGDNVGILVYPASGWGGARIFGEMAIHTKGIGSTNLYPTDDVSTTILRTMDIHGINSIFGQTEPIIDVIKFLYETSSLQEIDEGIISRVGRRLRKIVYGGSPMPPDFIKILTERGLLVRPVYSQTECGPIGTVPASCPLIMDNGGNVYYHPTALNFFVTLRDEEGNFRIVATNLLYAVAPVVHYENRDMGEWTGQNCESCGAPLFVLKGRVPEDLMLGSLKIRTEWVTEPLRDYFDRLGSGGGLMQLQVIEKEGGRFKLRIVCPNIPTSMISSLTPEDIREVIRRGFISQNIAGEDWEEFTMVVNEIETSNDGNLLVAHPRTGKILPVVEIREEED